MALTLKLNGSNFVSEETREAFVEALENPETSIRSHRSGFEGRASSIARDDADFERRVTHHPQPAVHAPSPVDSTRVLESLENGLSRSYQHQRETLRVHEQYLSYQAEYARIFLQLMQQQGELFSNGATQSEAILSVVQTLARSIEQFHQHQAETLDVHNQFLSQQATYSQAFVELLQQQVGGEEAARQQPPEPIAAQSSGDMRRFDALSAQTSDLASSSSLPASLTAEVLTEALLAIVSEKTGYPAEMLELDMDMEADLGIDSIKRVEILGALQDQYPDLPEIEADVLGELRTLEQVVAYCESADQHMQNSEAPIQQSPLQNEAQALKKV